LKILRVLIRHAIELNGLNYNPTLGIKRPKMQEIRSWTDAEIAQFEARWPIGTKQRLAFALMLNTGQRRSDVHRMTWADLVGDSIRVVQQKTGAKLTIHLTREVGAILAQTARNHVAILTTRSGKPFTVAGFGWFTLGRVSRKFRAIIGPNLRTHRRIDSLLTINPRSARRSSTSR
jgi:integrase